MYRATESAAWQEARYGKLWEQGVEGIEKYNDINKVEPMNRALKELNVQTWFAGLRREQSGSRANLPCWQFSVAYLKCCRLSTGITELFISTCKNMA